MNITRITVAVFFVSFCRYSLSVEIFYEDGDIYKTNNQRWDEDDEPDSEGKLRELRIPNSMCPPFDSCADRCSQWNSGFPFTCRCDSLCELYSDCCIDYQIQCKNGTKQSHSISDSSFSVCTKINPIKSYVYLIQSCAKSWTSADLLDWTDLQTFCEYEESKYCANDCKRRNEFCKSNIKSKCERSPLNFRQIVKGIDGVWYRNSACAICNGQIGFESASFNVSKELYYENNLQRDQTMRICLPSVDSCSYIGFRVQNRSLNDLCRSYSGPVYSIVSNHNGRAKYYKNIFCAMCNGEFLTELSCPSWIVNKTNFFSAVPTDIPTASIGITGVRNKLKNDLPAAFSILLNFGLDGQQRMVFSSEDQDEIKMHQEVCGKSHIWDPFSKICRKLYCSNDYILVDFKCVRKSDENVPVGDDDRKEPEAKEIQLDFVHLTLTVEMELLDLLNYYGKETNITEMFASSISTRFNINLERIRNVKINVTLSNIANSTNISDVISGEMDEHSIIFTIDFDLYEPAHDEDAPEISVNNIVSKMASSISAEKLNLFSDDAKGKVLEIQQTVDAMKLWCDVRTGGARKEYWNSAFSLVMNEDDFNNSIKEIYVSKVNKTYPKGEFVAYILYQVSDETNDLINVSRLVIVCDRQKLSDSCTRVKLDADEYTILSNGSLQLLNDSAYPAINKDKYEYISNDSVLVCLNTSYSNLVTEHYLQLDMTQAYVSLVFLCISVIALAFVFLTYIVFSSLRNLPGCNTMNLTFSLLAMQITFLVSQRDSVTGAWCKASAKLLHYEILCSFVWMNVMAYDLYKTFGSNTALTTLRSKNKYVLRYMLYAYGFPFIIICSCVLLDLYDETFVVAPRYGYDDKCWITNKFAAYAFFAFPLALVMIVNFGFYILTILAMRHIKHVVGLTGRNHQPGRKDVMLYARMAFVTGLTWTLIFIAAYVRSNQVIGQIIIYLFIIFNTLQGVFIFFVFVCNRRVASLYCGLVKDCCKHTGCCHKNSIMQRIVTGISRTVSSETTTSTTSTDTK